VPDNASALFCFLLGEYTADGLLNGSVLLIPGKLLVETASLGLIHDKVA
jgi:hypothetical protein